MRLQPPKDQDKFLGKRATRKIINGYIGSHRLIFKGGETTVKEYLDCHTDLSLHELESFLTMFPYEIQYMARIYLEDLMVPDL